MQTKLNLQQSLVAALKAAGVAAVVNAILFFVFRAAGVLTEDIFIQPGQTLTLAPVIISSIAPTLIAGIVFFLFEKYTNNGFRIFSIVAIVLGLLSLMSPFTQIKDVTVGFGVVLDIMHVVVVAALLYFLKAAVDSVRR
ncbi:MAG: hypothetical protein RIR11_807 [Bacteroidota bacterium]|jgi:hypothetical protein